MCRGYITVTLCMLFGSSVEYRGAHLLLELLCKVAMFVFFTHPVQLLSEIISLYRAAMHIFSAATSYSYLH